MRASPAFFAVAVVCLASSLGCTGDPVGEAPSDATVDSAGGGVDTRVDDGDTFVPKTDTDSGGADTGDDGEPPPKLAGKPCTKTSDCDPGGTTGAQCLLDAPTPICYGAKCTPPTVDPTISPCPDDGVCIDDGAGGGLCVPLCYWEPLTGTMRQGCLGNDLCWYVGVAKIAGANYAYGRCEGRCGRDEDCPAGTKCQDDGACVTTPKAYPGAIGDACLDTDDGTKCACVYSPATHTGYCSRFCHVGDETTCPTGYTCDADVPASVPQIPLDGLLGNCLKDCTADAECTNGYCEQHGAVSHKTCQPGSR